MEKYLKLPKHFYIRIKEASNKIMAIDPKMLYSK